MILAPHLRELKIRGHGRASRPQAEFRNQFALHIDDTALRQHIGIGADGRTAPEGRLYVRGLPYFNCGNAYL